jgi:hypothetical protein
MHHIRTRDSLQYFQQLYQNLSGSEHITQRGVGLMSHSAKPVL